MDVSEWERVYDSVDSQLRRFEARLGTELAGGRNDKDKRQIKQKLPTLRNDLSSLEASAGQWAANPRSGGMTDREARGKTQQVQELVRLYRKLEDAASRVNDSDRDSLLGNLGAGAGSADPYASRKQPEESEETMYMSNRDMLEQQRQRVDQDDAALESIAQGLGQLKQMGHSQQKQLVKQETLLDELRDGVDATDARMQGNIRRVELVEEGSRGGCCVMIIMLGLLALIISVLASNWMCKILPKTKHHCH